MRYGVGYKGSKSRIAKEIINILPRGDRFIDLFGSGLDRYRVTFQNT